jgi:hypothetical protein
MTTRGGEGSRADGSEAEVREDGGTEAPQRAPGDIDWSRPEKLQQASSLWVALWLAVPLLSCLIYGFLTR